MGDDATVSTKSVTDTDSFTLSQDGKDEHHYLELHQRSIIGLVVAPDKVVPLPMETQSDDDDCNSMSEPRKQHTGRRDSQQFVTQQQLDVVNGNIERLDGNIKKIEERLEQVESDVGQLKDMMEVVVKKLFSMEVIFKQLIPPDTVPSEVVVASVTTGECQSAHNKACASAATGVTDQLVSWSVPVWGTLKATAKLVRDGLMVASDAEEHAVQMIQESRGG